MNEPWKEEDSAFVDSFFLPGGILDPEDEEDIGILSALPGGQRIPSNPWGNEKLKSSTTSPVSYLHAAKQYEIEPASPSTFGEQTMEESEPRVNSPLRSIVRPPPGYDGYVTRPPVNAHLPNGVHSDVLSTNHVNHATMNHGNGMSHQRIGLMNTMGNTYNPQQSNTRYELSHNYSPSMQQVHLVDAYTATGGSMSVPELANEVIPKFNNTRSFIADELAKSTANDSYSILETEAASTSKHPVQNTFEAPVKETPSKRLNEEESKEQVPERSSVTSTSVGTGDSLDASSHMTQCCDGKDESIEHVPQDSESGEIPKDEDCVSIGSQSAHTDDLRSPQDTPALKIHPSSAETEISKLNDNINAQTRSDALEHHAFSIARDTVSSCSFKESSSPTSQNGVSLSQGILRPFSLVFRMATLLLLDLPRMGANALKYFFSAAYFWSLSTARGTRDAITSGTKATADVFRACGRQSADNAKSIVLLLAHAVSFAPAFVAMMSKSSVIQALEEPSSAFCYTVFYCLPSWCNTLAKHVDVPHWSAHFIITIGIYLVSHPVKPGILHRGDFPVSDVVGALFRNGNHCDQVFIDKYERRAAVRKRNERICSKCLRILRCCLPIFCLIDGFSYDGATIIGDSGASRLTTAYMMSLVRRNLAFSPIGWVSWAVQLLVATYLDVWILRDIIVLLLGLSSIRLIRYFDQKRLKKKRKRR